MHNNKCTTGVYTVIENPQSSMFGNYPPLVAAVTPLLEAGEAHWVSTHHCAFSEEPEGKRHLKPFKLFATGDAAWLQPVAKLCTCKGGIHVPLMRRDEEGKRYGTKSLKLSQAYSRAFANAIVDSWLEAKHTARSSSSASLD